MSPVETWNSAFPSSCKRVVRPPVELRRGTQPFSRGATDGSDLPSCCEGLLWVPFESVQGNQFLARVEVELSVVSTRGRNHGVPLKFQ